MRLVPFAALATFAILAAACGSDFQDEPVPGGGTSGTGGGTSGTGGGSAGQPPEDASVPDGESGTAGSSGSSAGAAGQPPDAGAEDGSAGDGGPCPSGYGDCDDDPSNGCETALDTEQNCGACDKSCLTDQLCINALCQLSCGAGRGDCDENPATGCETDTTSAVDHCGACGEACGADNGTPGCVDSSCTIDCDPGWGDCDDDRANGCEVETATDAAHCGVCGTACPGAAHATAQCVAGECGLLCDSGWGDCDGNPSNGCETNTTQSVSHCGACANACPIPAHATASCATSKCGYSCVTGWGDCNLSQTDGCEANLNTSTSHCGVCNAACGTAHGTATCSTGSCSIACASGYADCDGVNSNGCEVTLASNADHCGACGHDCQGGTCSNGVCMAWVLATVAAEPRNLAVSSTHVFWTTPSAVQGISRSGGAVTNLATGQPDPNGITVDDTHVYFTNRNETGNIMRVEPSGVALTTIVAAESPGYVAVDQDSIYFGDGVGVRRRSKNNSFSTYVAALATRTPGRIFVDTQYVYFFSPGYTDGWVGRDSIAATDDPLTLASGLRLPSDLAADSTHLYYVQSNVNGVTRVPKAGGTKTTYGDSHVAAVAVDDAHVFFSEDDNGRVMQVAKGGGTPVVRRSGASTPYKIEVRDGVVYWIERGTYQILAMVK